MEFIRHAQPSDARELAKLIDIAGEGLAMHLWSQSAAENQTPLEFGMNKAQNTTGGFSYRNAWIWEEETRVMGMLLAYPLDDPYVIENIHAFPEVVRPLIELEAEAPGSFYINGLATFPEFRGRGIGLQLLKLAEHKAPDFACSELSLIVADGNKQAISLYQKCGYQVRASRKIVPFPGSPLHSEHWLLMEKFLSN